MLKLSKCVLQVHNLGYVISAEGIATDLEKTKAGWK